MAEKSNEELLDDFREAAGQAVNCCNGYWTASPKDYEELSKARAAVLARMAGPGEVVVPVKPTPEMREAALRTSELVADREGYEYPLYDPDEVYEVMLAARPNNGGNDDASK